MRAALSSLSCFSCLKRTQNEGDEETGAAEVVDNNGAPGVPLQPAGHPSERSDTESLFGMSEGDVTVLPFSPAASQDRPLQEQRTLTRLYCKNGGYHLKISPEGRVSGGRQDNDPYGLTCNCSGSGGRLQLVSTEEMLTQYEIYIDILRLKAVSVGVVVIKGEHSERYLAMDSEGHLYGAQTLNDECHFIEKYEENHYNTYRSQKSGWYVGLKKNGQPKAGRDTHLGQKAVLFLPRPV